LRKIVKSSPPPPTFSINVSISSSLTAIKENVRAGTAGLNGTAKPGLLGTVKDHIKVRGVSALARPAGF